MRLVRSKDTLPEKALRSLLHRRGFRFRLHDRALPGKPDLVLPKHRTVIFVHGCFWHRHPDCPRTRTPATRQDYWVPKFERTVAAGPAEIKESSACWGGMSSRFGSAS